jgi:hypothetical protein
MLFNMPPRENPQAVQNWVTWLNTNYGPGTWVPMNGFTSITMSVPGANNTITFNSNLGFALKSFVNTQTGEVKSFSANKFYA